MDHPAFFLGHLEFTCIECKEVDRQALKAVAGNCETIMSRFKTERMNPNHSHHPGPLAEKHA